MSAVELSVNEQQLDTCYVLVRRFIAFAASLATMAPASADATSPARSATSPALQLSSAASPTLMPDEGPTAGPPPPVDEDEALVLYTGDTSPEELCVELEMVGLALSYARGNDGSATELFVPSRVQY